VPVSAAALLGRTVRWHGIRIGPVAEVILDPAASRLVGFVVACGDGEERFLPVAAAEMLPTHVELVEPLAIGEPEAVAWYRRRGLGLSGLLEGGAERLPAGPPGLGDVLIDDAGAVEAVVPAEAPSSRAGRDA